MNLLDLIQPRSRSTCSPERGDHLKYISATRLKTWRECPLKWYFRYIEKLPAKTSPALLTGKVIHAVLHAWNLARWRDDDTTVPAMRQVFETCWREQCEKDDMFRDTPELEAKEKSKAWSVLEYYFENGPIPPGEKPEAVEVKVERDLLAHGLPPLVGIIDLVRSGGRIVDFKSTARTPDPVMVQHTNEIQLGCYALLYREATGNIESGFEIHSMVKTKQPKLVVTPMAPLQPEQIRQLVRIMESYVRGVEAAEYLPSPGMHCQWCDYFKQCRKWRGGVS